ARQAAFKCGAAAEAGAGTRGSAAAAGPDSDAEVQRAAGSNPAGRAAASADRAAAAGATEASHTAPFEIGCATELQSTPGASRTPGDVRRGADAIHQSRGT